MPGRSSQMSYNNDRKTSSMNAEQASLRESLRPTRGTSIETRSASIGDCGCSARFDSRILRGQRKGRRETNKSGPVIASLSASTDAIGPGDSTLVSCVATDANGDTLVYDWFTDSRLVIKGNSPADHHLFNSPFNSHIFYHGTVTPFDSAWVECTVRDGKGGNAVL